MPASRQELRLIGIEASRLVSEIGSVYRARSNKQAQLDERIKRLQERYGSDIEALQNQQNDLVAKLKALVVPHFTSLASEGTRTIKLRSGTISLRFGPESLRVDDEEAVLEALRRLGLFRKYTKTVVSLVKNSLKQDPKLVSKLPGTDFVRTEKLHIRPNKLRGSEITLPTDGLAVPLEQED